MIEKVNMYHPDKVADRIAGALVDYSYTQQERPRCAFEVLLGHGNITINGEASVEIPSEIYTEIIKRIVGKDLSINYYVVAQDIHLSNNQSEEIRVGDNGVFRANYTKEYEEATKTAKEITEHYQRDGKYIFDTKEATICQSGKVDHNLIKEIVKRDIVKINPLGEWEGSEDVDAGCTNRKLGSDQPLSQPNGLHGKDLSKSDVSISIYLALKSKELGIPLEAKVSIGDDKVIIENKEIFYKDIADYVKEYINSLGGFEKFAEWGIQY